MSIALGASSSIISAPVRRELVVKHSGELARAAPHMHKAPCSDAELAHYAVRRAVGPAVEPSCRPLPGQGLWPQVLLQFSSVPAASKDPAVMRSNVRQHSAGTYFAHLYVVQSNEGWCAHPCNAPSWELAAPKPEAGSPYLLFEAAIWRQTRTVKLYRFDAEWEKRARMSIVEFCNKKSWGCEAYEKFRESRSILSVGPWPEGADTDDPVKFSEFLRGAFNQIFAKVNSVAGPHAYKGLTYSGHGGLADGSLFEGALLPEDAAAVLQGATSESSGGKLALLNFGTNCEEGHWNMLEALHPFADWILASDLNVGGLNAPNSTDQNSLVAAMLHLQDVAVLKRAMENRTAPSDVVGQVVDARLQLWQGEERKPIIQQHLRQSLSGFKSSSFPDFKNKSSAALRMLPAEVSLTFGNYVQNASCDVLAALRLLDATGSAIGNPSNFSVQSLVRGDRMKHHTSGPGPLELSFQALRPFYASTKPLFEWDKETNGLGFNRDFRTGRCDFMKALGAKTLAMPTR